MITSCNKSLDIEEALYSSWLHIDSTLFTECAGNRSYSETPVVYCLFSFSLDHEQTALNTFDVNVRCSYKNDSFSLMSAYLNPLLAIIATHSFCMEHLVQNDHGRDQTGVRSLVLKTHVTALCRIISQLSQSVPLWRIHSHTLSLPHVSVSITNQWWRSCLFYWAVLILCPVFTSTL